MDAIVDDWRAYYAERLVSPEQAVAAISSGDNVYAAPAQQIGAIVAPLLGRADELRDVGFLCFPQADFGWLAPDFAGHIDVNVFYANPWTREAVNRHAIDFTPLMFYGAHKAFAEGREEGRRIDVNVLTVTPPDEHGYVCAGNSLWDAIDVARLARTNIATVNEFQPRTFGDTWLHVSQIDWFVEDHVPLVDPPVIGQPTDPWDAAIAGYAGSLINNGDTIQLGAGSTTGNFVRTGGLDGKEDLGYFGELTPPGTVELVRRGVITGRRMTTHPGKFVATTAGNSVADRAFMNWNPAFELRGIDYVHNPTNIAANDHYVAINNALAIDLTGQIAASTIGPRIYSGNGGHFIFAMGAFMARGGRYVCVLPATALGGTVSRIVPQFEAGQIVTVPRDVADTVVTEFGIAKLLNRSVRERAASLIAIAHPDFRAELRRAAQGLFYP